MGGGRNPDEVACWPSADLGFMDPRASVNVLYGVKEQDDPEKFKQLIAEVERDTTPWELARLCEAQHVIDPRDTRDFLIRMLQVHRKRLKNGVGEHRLGERAPPLLKSGEAWGGVHHFFTSLSFLFSRFSLRSRSSANSPAGARRRRS